MHLNAELLARSHRTLPQINYDKWRQHLSHIQQHQEQVLKHRNHQAFSGQKNLPLKRKVRPRIIRKHKENIHSIRPLHEAARKGNVNLTKDLKAVDIYSKNKTRLFNGRVIQDIGPRIWNYSAQDNLHADPDLTKVTQKPQSLNNSLPNGPFKDENSAKQFVQNEKVSLEDSVRIKERLSSGTFLTDNNRKAVHLENITIHVSTPSGSLDIKDQNPVHNIAAETGPIKKYTLDDKYHNIAQNASTSKESIKIKGHNIAENISIANDSLDDKDENIAQNASNKPLHDKEHNIAQNVAIGKEPVDNNGHNIVQNVLIGNDSLGNNGHNIADKDSLAVKDQNPSEHKSIETYDKSENDQNGHTTTEGTGPQKHLDQNNPGTR